MSRASIVHIDTAYAAPLGPELTVQRALPLRNLEAIGPFVFLDHGGPMRPPTRGIAAHPHAGIEVITYLLRGRNAHRDSAGHSGEVTSGGVQWITSGSGMLHAEVPYGDGAGLMEAVQLWARQDPALDRFPSTYCAVQAGDVPEEVDVAGRIRLLAGLLPGHFFNSGPLRLSIPSTLIHITLAPGKRREIALHHDQEMGLFVLSGRGKAGGSEVSKAQIAILSRANRLVLESDADSEFDVLLLGGAPAPRPLVFAGSFVFNSSEAARTAEGNFRQGKMGQLDGVPF